MKIKKMFKQIRNNYVINQVKGINILEFEPDEIIRYHMVFSGRVQGVGFRLEIEQLALRLKLTGWIKNLESGSVEMEIQGMKNKIDFLLDFMNSLKRMKINQMKKDIQPVLNQEQEFEIL
ncbi:acylphosphatase [Lacrimispora indolis]|uniref:acylphosphatase n=1 Tax=Lacrimispora indolis TaxID=69825 RepID=UPI0004851DD3|nr:acylphosphatase [Lacrimispora indolis]